MCGRFNLITDAKALADFLELAEDILTGVPLAPRYNIAPSQNILCVLSPQSGHRIVSMMQWGLVPFWARDPKMGSRMINAKAETVAIKPAFRAAFRSRRCLIPATGFYEWQRQPDRRQPYMVRARSGGLFAMAGLWERWGKDEATLETTCILTRAANDVVQAVHERMPLILPPESFALWLNPEVRDVSELQPLLESDIGDLEAFPVSTKVNNPQNDQADVTWPLT